ncbi:MAG: hypothetical protein ACR2NM_12435 [Bythopirellula sp.]
MVALLPNCLISWSCTLFAQQENGPKTLPEPYRALALMALLAIALLGMLMIVATLLGGHWVRRWGDRVRRPSVPPDVLVTRKDESVAAKIPDEKINDGDTLGSDETAIP